jgi:hypothetical protein
VGAGGWHGGSQAPSRELALRRAPIFLGGAALMWGLIDSGPLDFAWLPLLIGVDLLVAASIGGKRAGYWSPGIVLTVWGTAVATLAAWELNVTTAAAYMLAVGLGVLVVGMLERHGFDVSLMSVGVATISAGSAFLLERYQTEVFGRARLYALALGAWGVIEAVRGLRDTRRSSHEPTTRMDDSVA